MKNLLICFILWLSLSQALFAQKKLPNLSVSELNGQLTNTAVLLQDSIPVLLAFWSTTCKPCIQEFNTLTEQWGNLQRESRFKVIAVSIDDARFYSKVRAYVASNEWPFTILLDKNQELKRALNVQAIPHVFVIDRKGEIVHTRIGYTVGSEQSLFDILKAL